MEQKKDVTKLNEMCEMINGKYGSHLRVVYDGDWFRLIQYSPLRFEVCKTRTDTVMMARIYQLLEDLNNG